jgi:methylglutaconyl-CoA hydratase
VKFGFTEVRLGVAPAMISVICLPKMRRGEAMEAFLRGNRFPASQAAELGLINRAVPGHSLDASVDAVIDDVVRGGPLALAAAKRLVNDIPAMPKDEAFALTTKLSGQLFAGDEAAAGMEAFLKREAAPWIPEM